MKKARPKKKLRSIAEPKEAKGIIDLTELDRRVAIHQAEEASKEKAMHEVSLNHIFDTTDVKPTLDNMMRFLGKSVSLNEFHLLVLTGVGHILWNIAHRQGKLTPDDVKVIAEHSELFDGIMSMIHNQIKANPL